MTGSGQTIAQYLVRENLGAGELGSVYLALDTTSGREVALEILPDKSSIDTDRLRQEVKAAAALDHWNIAKVYEFAKAGDIAFVAREHVPGRTLEEVLQSGPMDSGAALECARQIAGALAAGHSIGVTHRHLSPRNIVLDDQNRVRLVNFGLTVPAAVQDAVTVAPEQLDGRGADARSDIYSFGVVLRKMLGTPPPKPLDPVIARATRKNSARRYQLMEDVVAALDRAASDPAAATTDHGHRMLLAAAALVLAVIAAGWWFFGGRNAINHGPVKLTADSGLTTEGAISADGRMIVYASDRASAGVMNLWTQPVSGGGPSRLTNGPDNDHQPALSPDATRVAFRSERDGGGIWLVAASGGAPQLLVKDGREPRFSPDGRWIVYWSGDPLQPQDAAVWIIASSGGQPKQVPDFADARHAVWSPDSKHILFEGHQNSGPGRNGDWYVATVVNGSVEGRPTRTGAETLLHMQAFRGNADNSDSSFAVPEAWTAGQVVFSGRMTPMGRQNSGQPRLLRIPVSHEIMQAGGAAHEITPGAAWDLHPSLSASGRVVFSRQELKPEMWSVALDGSGDLQRLTQDAGDVHPSISGDGTRLAYRVPQADGASDIRVVDLAAGKQITHIARKQPRDWPVLLSPSGEELAYTTGAILRVRLPDGKPEKISRGWDQLMSWSQDGKFILVQRGWRGIGILDTTTGRDSELLRDDRYPVVEARFSPDDKWIAYTLLSRPHSQVFVAPVAAREADRVAISEDNAVGGSPAWSPSGDQIYYLAGCQGFRCIWARRLDPRSKQPKGAPFAVRHFHGMRYSLIGGIDPQNVGLAAARDKLVFGMFETTGNIWSLPSLPRP